MARVLIAEDEGILRMSFSMILRGLGHEVVSEVVNGEETLGIIDGADVDIVFMDISMDGVIDGIQACRMLKEKKPQVKVVFVSAYPESSYSERLSTVPYDGYLEKPVCEIHFQNCLEKLTL